MDPVTPPPPIAMMRRILLATVAICAALAIAVAARAHDFWLVPDAFAIAEGAALVVRGQTSSRFPDSESAVALDRVADARILSASADKRITELAHAGNSLVLRHRPTARGQRIVAVALHPRSVRESAASFRRYLELEGAPDALARVDREGLLQGRDSVTRRYAKYAKAVVEVGRRGPRAFSRLARHPLELVPLADPSDLRAGDTLLVRVLYRGLPLGAARVHASYVTHAGGPERSAVNGRRAPADIHLAADSAGVIRLPVKAPGLWNVRMIHVTGADAGSGADWDTHWTTMVFRVRERR